MLWGFIFSLVLLSVSAGAPRPAVDRTLFGTKCAYDWVSNLEQVAENSDMQVNYQGRTCTAIHVNMLVRHGSRHPGADDMEDIRVLAEKIKQHKGQAGELDFIANWTVSLTPEQGDMLNALGKQEMEDIGRRTGKRFKQLLLNKRDRMEYTSSTRERTVESGKLFSNGLSQYLYNSNYTVTPTTNNGLLRVYDGCEYFEKTVDDNDQTEAELNKFKETARYKQVKQNIANRLGFTGDWSLSGDDIEYIWEMCAFELMAGRDAAWCSFMDNMDRRVVNEASDIEDYYEDSYGNDVSGEIHCVVLQKLFTLMDDAITSYSAGTSYTVGSFMFGHSASMMGTLTALHLFKDVPPLRASTISGDRRFQTSKISPMAANLGFALYECPSQTGNAADSRYAVKLFHNERPLNLGQTNSEIIWYDLFKSAFENTLKCNINDLCKYPRDTSGGIANRATILGVVAVLVYLLIC